MFTLLNFIFLLFSLQINQPGKIILKHNQAKNSLLSLPFQKLSHHIVHMNVLSLVIRLNLTRIIDLVFRHCVRTSFVLVQVRFHWKQTLPCLADHWLWCLLVLAFVHRWQLPWAQRWLCRFCGLFRWHLGLDWLLFLLFLLFFVQLLLQSLNLSQELIFLQVNLLNHRARGCHYLIRMLPAFLNSNFINLNLIL